MTPGRTGVDAAPGGLDTPHALALERVSRRFGDTVALRDASLRVRAGTVHALLGENGAGKSTLVNVAFGHVRPDAGRVLVDGAERRFRTPADAMAAGLGMVHQHFTLVPAMTAAENVALGLPGRLDLRRVAATMARIGGETGLRVHPSAIVGEMSVASQQRVEIVKALVRGARVLMLDEPTAVLAPAEAAELLGWVRRFAAGGGAAVLITHKLREALGSADEVTVLRRGERVLHGRTADLDEGRLLAAMVGEGGSGVAEAGGPGARAAGGREVRQPPGDGSSRAVTEGEPSPAVQDVVAGPGGPPREEFRVYHALDHHRSAAPPVLPPPSAAAATTAGIVGVTPDVGDHGAPHVRHDPYITPPVRADEVVSHVSGPPVAPVLRLHGVGYTDDRGVTRLGDVSLAIGPGELVGVAAVEGAGHHELLRLLAGRLAPTTGQAEIPDDVGFVPEDRHRDALVLDFDLTENVVLRGSGRRRGLVRWDREAERTASMLAAGDVRAPDPSAAAGALSGGNQQKLVVGRELLDRPVAVVAESPTRGLDVRASAAVLGRLRAAAEDGAAVVVYSSDLDELLALADRVVVVHAGRVHEVERSREAVGAAMLGMEPGQA